jgi:hypothetical protein
MDLSQKYLDSIKPNYLIKGYPVPKWIQFSEAMLDMGFSVDMQESKSTVSKYLYLKKGDKKFKIRFSNHKPNYNKELGGDCNYYVGVGHTGMITTEQLIDIINKKTNNISDCPFNDKDTWKNSKK